MSDCKQITCCQTNPTGLGPEQPAQTSCKEISCCQADPDGLGPEQPDQGGCKSLTCCQPYEYEWVVEESCTVNCPEPFTCSFTGTAEGRSYLSLEDAQREALELACLSAQFQASRHVLYFEWEALSYFDDDARLRLDGEDLDASDVYYWDHTLSQWTQQWRRLPNFAAPAPGTPTLFPVTSANRKWNLGWYGGNTPTVTNFIRIRYEGDVPYGSELQVDLFDGWQNGYRAAPWQLTVYWGDSTNTVYTGGSTFAGTTPDLPSPPRINPAGPVPYQSFAQYAAANGMANYFSQGYPAGGPYFEDYYPNGTAVITR